MPQLRRSLRMVLLLLLGPAIVHAQDMPLTQVLIEGEDWQLVGQGYEFTEGPAADAHGNVYFTDVRANRIYRIDAETQQVSLFAEETAGTNGLVFGPDGRLYGCRNGEKKIVAYNSEGDFETIAEGVASNDITIAADGGLYFTDPGNRRVWYVNPEGEKRVVAEGFRPNGIILWQNSGTLVVTDSEAPHLWTYRVEKDGRLSSAERYYSPLRLLPGRDRPGSDGMAIDDDGRLYLASYAGIQMFDPTGRMGGVIASPQKRFLSNVTFGGKEFRNIYATCSDKVYRRRVKPAGTPLVARRNPPTR